MNYYHRFRVDDLHCEDTFVCDSCNKLKAAKTAHGRYKIRFKLIEGEEKKLCIRCAAKVTSKSRKEFIARARKLYPVK